MFVTTLFIFLALTAGTLIGIWTARENLYKRFRREMRNEIRQEEYDNALSAQKADFVRQIAITHFALSSDKKELVRHAEALWEALSEKGYQGDSSEWIAY